MRCLIGRKRSGGVCVAALAGLLLLLPGQPQAHADSLPPFTGYTRPGAPNDTREDGKIIPVAADPKARKTAIGGTVYFMVLERKGKDKSDPWGGGVGDLAGKFRRGVDFGGTSSPALDTAAKYLYLYQVVNDRGTALAIQSASVELLVDLKKKGGITSWGWFSGVGFGLPPAKDRPRGNILPVSSNYQDTSGGDRVYVSPSPAVPSGRTYRLTAVETQKTARSNKDQAGVARVIWEALDPAVEPDYVMLLGGAGGGKARPTFRALWNNSALGERMRSTVFGFTSNLPPALEPVQLRGTPPGPIQPAAVGEAAEGREVVPVAAQGRVPTPQPAAAPAAPAERTSTPPPPPGPPPLPALAPAAVLGVPVTPGGGTSGGLSAGGGMGGGGFGSGVGGGGGGVGGGSGGGTLLNQAQQMQQQTGQQQQQQAAANPQASLLQQINLSVQVSVSQELQQDQSTSVTQSQEQGQGQQQSQQQRQRQRQRQQQRQHQKGPPREIIPEPPALVLGLVGLSFFVWQLGSRGRRLGAASLNRAPLS